ncbi:MAG: hypothetical protein MK179_00105 [Pirellulaceae bacterium]|nr:hypothetical protein [Pirellulaceae bacterium]
MTTVRTQSGTKSRSTILPARIKLACWTVLLLISIAGLVFTDDYVPNKDLHTHAYGVFLVVGAVAMGCLMMRLDEWRQMKRWNSWSCPKCSTSYALKDFSKVQYWGTAEQKKRAGVLLSCHECGETTAFHEKGGVRNS